LDKYFSGGELKQFQALEGQWFAYTVRQATSAFELLYKNAVLLVIRKDIGPTVLDEEIVAALQTVPAWLVPPINGGK